MDLDNVGNYAVEQGVALITIDSPPVNALSAAVRRAIARGIAQAESDDTVTATVIICSGRTFFAGADINELGKPLAEPTLRDLQLLMESARKPVIAAMHGTALGGGLELALAAHFRMADPSTKLGFPEVKLGLVPGAGGTQRLPRLVGVEKALTLITSGDPIGAAEAHALGLVDALAVEGSLKQAAIDAARELSPHHRRPGNVRDQVGKLPAAEALQRILAHFRQTNARRFRNLDAPAACIDAVEAAATLPFDEGLAVERRLFEQLVGGAQSAALRHAFLAERQATKPPQVHAQAPAAPIRCIGVVGAGTMGAGIAMNFLEAGLPVTIVETAQEALDRGMARVRKTYESSVTKGKLEAGQVERRMSLLTGSLAIADLVEADLIIEAVFENMELKLDVFKRLDGVAKPDAVLATNTSFLNVEAIAAATKRPERVLGLHFFSPANVMRLVEIVRTERTAGNVLASAAAITKAIGKVGVVVGNGPGFVGNRMLAARGREADRLLAEGALPQDVDRVLVDFGFAMGPFQTRDLVGLDVGWNACASASASVRDLLNEQGRHGQKTGAGYYDYDEARRPTPSAVTATIIESFAKRAGVTRRTIADEEMLDRMLYAMVNEGAKILEEGVAVRSSDIDVIWLTGYGWPRYRGGPMYWADQQGLAQVLAGLERLAKEHGDEFAPAALIRDLAAQGRTFASVA
jgi:3-hydroxyacyl-CoA dehydrogenase